ncbi:hypothetical protein ES705_23979 [subsurface metagenome]
MDGHMAELEVERKVIKMRRCKLTTMHKLLIMLIQPVKEKDSDIKYYTRNDIQRGFKIHWDMEVSSRNITRLITRLEKDRVIKRGIHAYLAGKNGPRIYMNKHEIIDAEKGFRDLFVRS